MADVTVPIAPLVDWWKGQHLPHQHLHCVCTTGGVCASMDSLARRVGVSHSTIHRRLREGRLTVAEADTWAIRLGRHPLAIWTNWTHLRTCEGWRCDQRQPTRARAAGLR